jgi:hypothetical protein
MGWYQHEPGFGMKIIFAALINDPNIAVLLGFSVRKNAINFVPTKHWIKDMATIAAR